MRAKNSVMPAPTPPTSHQNRPPSRPHVRPFESDAALVSVKRRSVFMRFAGLKIPDAHRTVRVEPEDFEERKYDCRSRRDDGPADNGHFALVHVAAPDGKAAVDDRGYAQHKAEHHDDRQAVAYAGFQVGGIEARTAAGLREGGKGVDDKKRRADRERAETGARGGLNSLFRILLFSFARAALAADSCAMV